MKGKTLVIILLVTLFDIRDFSAQSIIEEKLEKLSLHLSNKDAEKAERVWESINFSDIESLSDSLKCMSNTHSGNAGSPSSDFIHLPILPFWIFGKMDKCFLPNRADEIPA